jgi:hypothetical protein
MPIGFAHGWGATPTGTTDADNDVIDRAAPEPSEFEASLPRFPEGKSR